MSARTTVARDLANVTDETDDVVVRVLLSTGQTVQGTQFHVRQDGLVQMQAMNRDALAVIIDPAHIIASFVPETDLEPNPWG